MTQDHTSDTDSNQHNSNTDEEPIQITLAHVHALTPTKTQDSEDTL